MARSEDLTVDYKKLLRLSVADRVSVARSPVGQSYLASLTPSQYNSLFPSYYKNSVPSYGGDGGGTVSPAPSGGGGGTVSPAPSGGGGGNTAETQPQQNSGYTSSALTRFEEAMKKEGVVVSQTPQNTPSAPATTTPVLGGNSLRAVRSRQMKELENPEVRAAVLARAEIEVGGQPKAQKGWMETLFNRAAAAKISLYDAVAYNRNHPSKKHNYYPNKDQARWESMRKSLPNGIDSKFSGHLSSVGAGSNETDYATDNASGTLAQQRFAKFGGKYINGELYYNNGDVPSYSNWARQQRKADAEEAKKPKDVATDEQIMPEGTSGPGSVIRPRQGGGKGVATGEGDLYGIAQSKRPDKAFQNFETRGGLSKCGMGTGAVVDAMFGTSHTKGGIGANAGAFAGKNAKTFIPELYSGPQAATTEYMNNPSQWRIGDVIASQGGKRGIGHIQTWNGKQWVSDHKQPSIYQNNYHSFTLHRVKPESYNNISAEYLKSMDSNNATNKYIGSLSGKVEPGSTAQQSATGDFPASTQASQEVKQKIKEFPQGFLESLPEGSRVAISNLNENERNRVAELVSASYDKHGAEKTATIVQGIFDQKPSQQAATATLVNTPLDKLPEVNPEGFGLGKVHGKRIYSDKEIAQREAQQTGMFSFEGFGDEFKGLEIPVASGGTGGASSVAPGTYKLTSQELGPNMRNKYYKKFGIPTTGDFSTVWNLGLEGSPTNIGVDPKTGKARTQMQIHSGHIIVKNTKDIEKLTSLGCIKPGVNQYAQLNAAIHKANKLAGGKLAIQVLPGNKPGEQRFVVMPAGLATNPISVDQAVQNTQETGKTVTGDPVNTTTTTTSSTGVDTSPLAVNPETQAFFEQAKDMRTLDFSKGDKYSGTVVHQTGFDTTQKSLDWMSGKKVKHAGLVIPNKDKLGYSAVISPDGRLIATAKPETTTSHTKGYFDGYEEGTGPKINATHTSIAHTGPFDPDVQGKALLKSGELAKFFAERPGSLDNITSHSEIIRNRNSTNVTADKNRVNKFEGGAGEGTAFLNWVKENRDTIQKQVDSIQQSQVKPAQQESAPAAEPPKQESAPAAEPPKTEQAPSAEPAPKAMATGGTIDIPPGEHLSIFDERGKLIGKANKQEYISVENGKLKVDPATLKNDEVPTNAYADDLQQQPQQSQEQPQYKNMAQMVGSSATPAKADVGFINIHSDTPSAMRHLAQTRTDPYRNGTGFNLA